jgi:hypothetical protein
MRKQTILLILGLALGITLLGCGSATPAANNATSAAPPAQVSATATSAQIPTPTNAPAAASDSNGTIPLLERLLPDPSSRAFRYAGAEFVIQAASISNRNVMNPDQTMPGNPWVNVVIKATNNQAYPVTTPKFEITFADGTNANGLDGIRLNQNGTQELNLRGIAKADTVWDGAVLTLSEAGKEPLKISLTGAPAKADLPRALKPGDAVTATNKYGEKIMVQVTDAQLDIDGIVTGQRAERAPVGKRFVRVTAQAQNMDAKNGMSVGNEYLQLRADGAPAEIAFDESGAQTIPLDESANLTVYFLVPAEAKEFKLVVAPDGQAPQEIALTP